MQYESPDESVLESFALEPGPDSQWESSTDEIVVYWPWPERVDCAQQLTQDCVVVTRAQYERLSRPVRALCTFALRRHTVYFHPCRATHWVDDVEGYQTHWLLPRERLQALREAGANLVTLHRPCVNREY